MALVRQGFKLLFLLILIVSCKSLPQREIVKKSIIIKPNEVVEDLTDNTLDNSIPLGVKILENGSISAVYQEGSDIWIGKLGGALLRYNVFTGERRRFYDDEYSVIDFSVKTIKRYNEYIVSLQSNRLQVINTTNQDNFIIPFPDNISRGSSLELFRNKLVFSTLGYGLWEVNIKKRKITKYLDSIKFVSSLKNIDNNLYIGSMRDGLYIYNGSKILSRTTIPVEIFRKNITSIGVVGNTIYLGTAKNGLLKWDRLTDKVEKKYNGENVSSIYISENYNLISFMGFGVLIESGNSSSLKSIKDNLITNNITTVSLHDNLLLTGNLKKGLVMQELTYD